MHMMLFSLSLLYATVTIEEDSLNYNAMMHMFKSLLTLEDWRCRAECDPRASL